MFDRFGNPVQPSGSDGADTLTGGAGHDVLLAKGGADLVSGQSGNDTLNAGGGDDILCGERGNDSLLGMAGNDRVFGQIGADRLSAGAGNDLVDGGKGNDTLSGGRGEDDFVFRLRYGADRITDFNAAQGDQLLLSDDLWSGALTAEQLVARFGRVSGDSIVLTFNAVTKLTLEGITDLDRLAGAIDLL